jgi:hypothetical protein
MTEQWLTGLLRATGGLEHGEVRTVEATLWSDKTLSRLYKLKVSYTEDVPLPSRFVVKVSIPSSRGKIARRRRWKEYEFYTNVVPAMVDPPIPRAYATSFDSHTLLSVLLLEDLSETHTRPRTPLSSTPPDLHGSVDCLAAIHAWWWAHPDLMDVTLRRDADWIETSTVSMQSTVTRFLAACAQDLPETSQSALESVSSAYSTLMKRSADMPLTIVHGDAHPWNFLSPIKQAGRPTCLLDWEGWSIEPGPHDLTSLLALHLPTEGRAVVEQKALEHYVRRLQARGVSGYDLETCVFDYRRSVARRVFSPVGMWARGSTIKTWRPILDRITAAFYQLECDELL